MMMIIMNFHEKNQIQILAEEINKGGGGEGMEESGMKGQGKED